MLSPGQEGKNSVSEYPEVRLGMVGSPGTSSMSHVASGQAEWGGPWSISPWSQLPAAKLASFQKHAADSICLWCHLWTRKKN